MNSKYLLLVQLSCSLLLVACTKSSETKEAKNSGTKTNVPGKGQNRPPPLVEAFELKDFSSPETLKVPVVLEGRKQMEVFARGQGRVLSLEVAQGSFVRAGAVLFTLDRSEPGESYLPAPILAPAAGKVAQWFVAPGNQVSAQTPVALLVEDSFLKAKVPIALDDWQRVTPQTLVRIVRDGNVWDGKIVSIPKAVSGGLGRVEVEVEIENKNKDLRAGLSAEAELTLPSSQRLLLPASAVLLTSDGAFVFKIVDDTLMRVPVRMRPVTLDLVEVLEPGFAPGDKFVVSGFSRLSANMKVRVSTPKSGSAAQPEVKQ